MFGLNRRAQVGDAHVQRLRSVGSEQAGVMGDYLDGYVDIGRRQGRTAQSLYDPTPVIYLAHPGRFELRMGRVDIELSGRHTRGMTVCDL